jgi:hypothetical protein
VKLQHVMFTIADNGVSGEHLHVLLDEELPASARLWDVVHLPAPHHLTGVRSPPSRYCTIQPLWARNLASALQGDQP